MSIGLGDNANLRFFLGAETKPLKMTAISKGVNSRWVMQMADSDHKQQGF